MPQQGPIIEALPTYDEEGEYLERVWREDIELRMHKLEQEDSDLESEPIDASNSAQFA